MGSSYSVHGVVRLKEDADPDKIFTAMPGFDAEPILDPDGNDDVGRYSLGLSDGNEDDYQDLIDAIKEFASADLSVESSCSGEDAEWDLFVKDGVLVSENPTMSLSLSSDDWSALREAAAKIEDAAVRDRVCAALAKA